MCLALSLVSSVLCYLFHSFRVEFSRQAVRICWEEFSEHVRDLLGNWVPSRIIVLDAMKIRKDVDVSGRILKISRGKQIHSFRV